jgi:hypothetical protein
MTSSEERPQLQRLWCLCARVLEWRYASAVTQRPTTSASAHSSAHSLVVKDDGLEPDLPTPASVVLSVVAGVPVLLFATICAGALWEPAVRRFDDVHWAGGVVAAISGVGLAVFVRRWWGALRSTDSTAERWPWLVVPFFVVVGAALGIAFMTKAGGEEFPGARAVGRTCREHAELQRADDVEERCVSAGTACAARLLEADQEDASLLKRCINDALKTP